MLTKSTEIFGKTTESQKIKFDVNENNSKSLENLIKDFESGKDMKICYKRKYVIRRRMDLGNHQKSLKRYIMALRRNVAKLRSMAKKSISFLLPEISLENIVSRELTNLKKFKDS